MLTTSELSTSADSSADAVRRLRQLCDEMAATIERLPNEVATSPAVEVEALDEINWHRILFDEPTSDDPQLIADRQALVAGVAQGEDAVLGLVGRLFVFGASATEERPPLLKEIGEAFYRWATRRTTEPAAVRDALVRRLTETCDRDGLGHRIELVQVGDRFDPKRHQAATGGWEITTVRGWVVLRENGSVYTKAIVDVR